MSKFLYFRHLALLLVLFGGFVAKANAQEIDDLQDYLDQLAAEQPVQARQRVIQKDGEIEIVENTSIFNKHLDEILYFFEKTDYDVVMLEDLDRFESIDIFLKLRELNLLLNESKVIERKIFFVYAVRDDMFQDAERVKCFDYITTVIPVINRSNAKNQLKEDQMGEQLVMSEVGPFKGSK